MTSSGATKPTGPGGEEIPDRPGTAMSLSDQNGTGEDSMKSFFNTYMTSILKPFAENVEELHKVVTTNAQSVTDLSERIDSLMPIFDEHRGLLTGLRADLDPVVQKAEAIQEQLDANKTERAQLKEDIEALKPRIDALEMHSPEVQRLIEELQNSLKDTRCRVGKYIDEQAKTDREIARMQPIMEQITADLKALGSAHDNTSQGLSRAKADLQTSIEQLQTSVKARTKDHSDLQTRVHESLTDIDARFRPFDERHDEVRRQLQSHQEIHTKNEETMVELQKRLAVHDGGHDEHRDKLNKVDVTLTDHNVRAVETSENVRKLIQLMEEFKQDTRESIAGVDNKFPDVEGAIKLLQERVHVVRDKKDEKDYIQLLKEDMDLSFAKTDRLDAVMGLEPLTKENLHEQAGVQYIGGIMVSNDQVERYRSEFNRLDKDGSGQIGTNDIADILRGCGVEDPPMDMVAELLAELDTDNSGEVSCDEFLILMSRVAGPDGTIDVNSMYRRLSDSKSAEAAQRELFAMVPVHEDKLQEQATVIEQEQDKLSKTETRVRSMESDHLDLVNEVRKLREGLDLNQEYWKGLSKGLKETKKSVHKEGEGEMLPSATRLRNLPPLTARPATAGNLSSGYAP